MERRDRGPQGWPQDCYCDKYGPDGIPHPVKNKEERYNHKRRYAHRNVVQANLLLCHRPPNDRHKAPISIDSEDESTSSPTREPAGGRERLNINTDQMDTSSQSSSQGSAASSTGTDMLLSTEHDTYGPSDNLQDRLIANDWYDPSDDEMGLPPDISHLEPTIEPEDLEAGNWERYVDARASDVESTEQDNEDSMRLEFPELFDPEDDSSVNIEPDDKNIPVSSSRSSQLGDVGSLHMGVGTKTLNEGVDMDTPNIAMLRRLNTNYPYGETTHMDIPEDLALSLDYFRVKVHHNMPTSAFEDMMKVGKRVSMDQEGSYRVMASALGNYTAINHVRYDCCRDNCVCFVDWPDEQSCPICEKNRLIPGPKRIPYSTFDYIPITHRLRLLRANPETSAKMKNYVSYRHRANADNPEGIVTDFWDGQLFKDLRGKGFFGDVRDIALAFSTDGLQLFKIGTYDVWPLLALIINLPPTERIQKDNMVLLGLIPGVYPGPGGGARSYL